MENRHGSRSKNLPTEVGSIVVFTGGIFVLFSILTYHTADPGFFTNSSAAAKNACGVVGAYVASMALETLGIASFLLPAAFIFIAAAIHKREGRTRLIGTLGGMSVAVMSLTVFLTLQWKYWPYGGSLLLTGGAFGAWLSMILVSQFNPLGSSIVSLLVFCLALVLSTPVSIAQMAAKVARVVGPIIWHFMKLTATYMAYLLGLAAMRTAHAAGDLLQGLIEGAATRAKDRARAMAMEGKKKREIEVDAEMEALPEPEFEEISEPEIGPEGSATPAKKKSKKKVGELAAAAAAALPELPDESSASALESTLSSEAPNALPELEAKGEKKKELAPQEVQPVILPPEAQLPLEGIGGEEKSKADAKAAEAAAKAAAKLAKIAARSKKGNWKLPEVEFLKAVPKVESSINRERLLQNSQILRQKFLDFGIDGEVTAVRPGPVITLYEFKPGPGVKVSRIASLADDLSMALSAQSVRILAPMPGKSVVGIEIPSDNRETVYMREFLQHQDFYGPKHSIPVVMGKDIGGQTYLSDLAKMPHLLCAGQTGSGKSVFMNGLICSLLYRFTPDELRMILVDPKFIEFRGYQDIPHLLLPVVDDPKHASTALKWAVREMERRYRILAMMGSRNLAAYNQKCDEMGPDALRDFLTSEENQPEGLEKLSGGDWIEAFEPDESGAPRFGKLPYIVVIIDELADLMMIAKKEVEISIARIAQKARAAGIHLVIATQRPSTDVVTGLIKANLPSRASFRLASYIDSKTILDGSGAERLLGQGDMLFIPPGTSSALRLHGAYLDDDEIGKITSFLKEQGKPAYRDEILVDSEAEGEGGEGEDGEDADDPLMQEAVELVKRSGHASASFLQRHLKVGYNRAARMIETMEMRGVVGPADGARPREVLIR